MLSHRPAPQECREAYYLHHPTVLSGKGSVHE